MLILNILNLTRDKIISLKYIIKPQKKNIFYLKHKYIYNNLDKIVVELINLLNSLSITYLYIYKYIALKQKILLTTNYFYYIYKLKIIAVLTSNFYIYNSFYSEIFSNWNLLKKKLIIYKWLKYFFLTNLVTKKIDKNIFYNNFNLYILYIKLKLKYNGLKNIHIFPATIIFITSEDNKLLKKILTWKKNIIFINDTNRLTSDIFSNMIIINTINKNFSIINFILEIINTAIFHSFL